MQHPQGLSVDLPRQSSRLLHFCGLVKTVLVSLLKRELSIMTRKIIFHFDIDVIFG